MEATRSKRILFSGIVRVALALGFVTFSGAVVDRLFQFPALVPPPWAVVGLVPLLFGLLLEGSGTYAFWKFGLGTPHPLSHPRQLVRRGPYARSRNPLYVARLSILVGLAFLLQSVGVLVLATFVLIGLHLVLIPREEMRLEARLGAEYVEYRSQVARWFTLRRGSKPKFGREGS
jgi:protein-S-isoprenylcysteine O-methyltransferase Ste14